MALSDLAARGPEEEYVYFMESASALSIRYTFRDKIIIPL